MKGGGLGIGKGGEVVEDGAESTSGDLKSAAAGKVDEVRFVVVEIGKLIDGVAIEKGGENGEEVEALVVDVDADGELEPAAGFGLERGF